MITFWPSEISWPPISVSVVAVRAK